MTKMMNPQNDVQDVQLVLDVKTTLPVIASNFETIKKQLTDGLKKYNLTVDENSVKAAKSMATEINALSNQIDTLRKEKVKELSAPIKDFENKAKELVSICQQSRTNLLDQVKVFEDKQREECLKLLQSELSSQYIRFGVKAEFQTVKVEDLALLSHLNKTGLAKKAVDTVEERVLDVKRFQEKIEQRLLSLEGYCLKSGLAVAFTPEHINHFLMVDSDEEYEKRLNNLIEKELSRQEVMKKAIEEKARKEMVSEPQPVIKEEPKEQPKLAQDGQPMIEVQPVSIQYQNPAATTQNSNNGSTIGNNRRYTVTATFEIEVDERLEPKLEAMLLKKFEQACFKTMPEIQIVKH